MKIYITPIILLVCLSNLSTTNSMDVMFCLQYNNTPGLLGEYGHVKFQIDIPSSPQENRFVVTTKQLISQEINTIFDINPIRQRQIKNKIKYIAEERSKIENKIINQRRSKFEELKQTFETVGHLLSDTDQRSVEQMKQTIMEKI